MHGYAVELRDPKKLKNHPLNLRIYGDKPDPEFVASVKEHGITDPLHVLADGTVVLGNRRKQAAVINSIKEVPVIVRVDLVDPLEIERVLILGNRYREKTTEQKAREYERFKEIEAEQAAQRSAANLKRGEHVPDPPKKTDREKQGDSRKNAAEAVGMSATTAERAATVVHKIDELTAAGDTESAAALADTLNNRSVAAASREAAKAMTYDDALYAIQQVNSKAHDDISEWKLKIAKKDVIALASSGDIGKGLKNLRACGDWRGAQNGKPAPKAADPDPPAKDGIPPAVHKRVLALEKTYNVFGGHVAWLKAHATQTASKNALNEIDEHLKTLFRNIQKLKKQVS
jgi:ParB-like chromosome segregation protein Spo0J